MTLFTLEVAQERQAQVRHDVHASIGHAAGLCRELGLGQDRYAPVQRDARPLLAPIGFVATTIAAIAHIVATAIKGRTT